MRSTVVASFVLICGSIVSTAQAIPEKQAQVGSVAVARSVSSDLMARSEMQGPKPIPIVKPLRFAEIPVGLYPRIRHPETARPPIQQPPSPSRSEHTDANSTDHPSVVEIQ
jgi:hypothetical protein